MNESQPFSEKGCDKAGCDKVATNSPNPCGERISGLLSLLSPPFYFKLVIYIIVVVVDRGSIYRDIWYLG